MKALLMTLVLLGSVVPLHAEETIGEKTEATAKDVKRSVKKGAHRTKEVLCAKGDAKCLAQKGKHRVEEGVDATKDKASEIKNDVDTDTK